MKTRIEQATTPDELARLVERAVALLKSDEVVALPTETVYGLAGNALSAEAALKIFETKKRPRFDPLIVHLPERSWLERVAKIPDESRPLVSQLIDAFWPGPLTLLLPRTKLIPDIVTAGLTTVAVRMSAHPVFAAVATKFGRPLAAPSANRFGRISPTTARHVLEELSGKIPLIVDGGLTTYGVESTIVAPMSGQLAILRAGPITREELLQFAPVQAAPSAPDRPQAPGQLASHYAPRTRLTIASSIDAVTVPAGQRYGALLWASVSAPEIFQESRHLARCGDMREAARNLFRHLRELDAAGLDCIVAEALPEEGLGAAIMERLQRASAR